MTALGAAVAAVCAVLVAAGVAKLTQPAGTGEVLRTLGVPGGTAAARGLGAVEVLLGLTALTVGGRWTVALVALAYAAAASTTPAARRAGLATCGCFGARSPAPSPTHAGLDLLCAGIAAAGAVASVPPLADLLGELGVPAAAGVLGATVVTAAALLAAFLRPTT